MIVIAVQPGDWRKLAVIVATAWAGVGAAQDDAARTELEAGASREVLTGSRGDWESRHLFGAHQVRARQTAYAQLRETERFALRDTEVGAGLYYPLADWTLLVEGSRSAEHRVLPRHSLFAQMSRPIGAGWSLSGGWRRSEYNAGSADLVVLGAERYWTGWRGAYTLYSGRPEGAGSAAAHRFQLARYYDGRSSVGISLTTGREVENVGPPAGVITTDVRGAAVGGRHWLTPGWALTWEVLTHEQGSLYRREGVALGVRHRF